MRKFVTVVAACLCFSMLCVNAQDALSSFRNALENSDVTFSYEFRAVRGKVPFTGSGHVCVSDMSFRVDGNGVEIISDGRQTWVLDRDAQEAVVESVEPTVAGLLSNPVLLIIAFDKFFNVDSCRDVKGGTEYALSPKEKSGGITSLSLTISGNVVTAAAVTLSDGTVTDFIITEMTYTELARDIFVFDEKTLGKDWVVTDMR